MDNVTCTRQETSMKCARCGRVHGHANKSIHDPKQEAEICDTCYRVEGFENQYDTKGNLVKKGACGDMNVSPYWN